MTGKEIAKNYLLKFQGDPGLTLPCGVTDQDLAAASLELKREAEELAAKTDPK